ncbi:MAG TPA: hypothetical protein VN181_16420, partial [Thermoanaerobaculia bacterium]|nr:hypothetical protein [Thermoanaerobaculia bacterium]
TRERVTAHLAECADCYGWWEGAVAATDAAEETNVVPMPKPRTRALLPIAASLVIAAGLGAVFKEPILDAARPTRHIERLARATQSLKEFPTQTRLAGPFPDNLEPRPTSRGFNDKGTINIEDPRQLELNLAAADAEAAAADRETKDNLHALGVAHMLLNHRQQALDTLQHAIRKETGQTDLHAAIRQSRDAALLSDLAAAYSAGGDYSDALAATERARQLDPASLSVLYNRAYALQNIDRDEAKRAWEEYLRHDTSTSSVWAKAARKHLDNFNPIQ